MNHAAEARDSLLWQLNTGYIGPPRFYAPSLIFARGMQMIVDIEKKALWVREQQEEHKRVQAAYAQIAAGYEVVQAEKRTLQLRVRQAEAQSRQEDHLRRSVHVRMCGQSHLLLGVLTRSQRSAYRAVCMH